MAATVKHSLTNQAWTIISTGAAQGSVNHLKGSNVLLTQVVGNVAPADLATTPTATLKRGQFVPVFGLGINTDYIAARSIGATAEISFTAAVE